MVPTFPNAKYYLSGIYCDACHNPDLIASRFPYAPECLYPLEDMGILELMEGEYAITSELTTLPTPGHTPGHMSMFISSGNDRALIIGDVLGSPMHASEPDQVYLPDSNVNQARETRHRLLDMAESDGMVILGSHMTQPGWGTIVRWRGKRFWQGI